MASACRKRSICVLHRPRTSEHLQLPATHAVSSAAPHNGQPDEVRLPAVRHAGPEHSGRLSTERLPKRNVGCVRACGHTICMRCLQMHCVHCGSTFPGSCCVLLRTEAIVPCREALCATMYQSITHCRHRFDQQPGFVLHTVRREIESV